MSVVRIAPSPTALAHDAAAQVATVLRAAVAERGVAHAMFASGNSRLEFPELLVSDPTVAWGSVIGFHMDEYVGIGTDHAASNLCVLGVGENGHLAFNDPALANFKDPEDVKMVEFDVACREQQVGEGIPALRRSSDPCDHGDDSCTTPGSILQECDHATLYLEPASAARLRSSGV